MLSVPRSLELVHNYHHGTKSCETLANSGYQTSSLDTSIDDELDHNHMIVHVYVLQAQK